MLRLAFSSCWASARRSARKLSSPPSRPTRSSPTLAWAGRHSTTPASRTRLAVVDSLDGPLRPLGLGRIGTRAREAQHGVPGQGAEGDPRLGPEVGVRVMCCSTVQGPSLSSEMAQGQSAARNSLPTTRARARSRSPTWTIPSSSNGTWTSSSGWASGTTAIPTSTTWTSARSAGGASGT